LTVGSGLEVVAVEAQEKPFEHSPEDLATRIENRTITGVWGASEVDWNQKVEPALAALRALPQPDRPRRRTRIEYLIVLTRI
jgi:hypothetical protein